MCYAPSANMTKSISIGIEKSTGKHYIIREPPAPKEKQSYAIVFSSKTGNTELLADTLHSCLPQAECCYFGNPNPAAMEADTLYVGFWTDTREKQMKALQTFFEAAAGKAGALLLVPLVLAAAKNIFNKILKTVQKDLHSSNTVIGSFMCQGKMPMSVRQRYENMKKQPLHLPNLDAMIENSTRLFLIRMRMIWSG